MEILPADNLDETSKDKVIIANNLRSEPVERARIALSKSIVFKVFLVILFVLTLAEPILVAYPPHGIPFSLQIIVLALSTWLFFVGLILIYLFYPEETDDDPEEEKTMLLKFAEMFDDEVIFDFLCLLWGWIFLFDYPGVAALRCFRLLRLSWYFKYYQSNLPHDYIPTKHLYSFLDAVRLNFEYLKCLTSEIFTARSLGGHIVLGMFFYMTYLFAVVYWNEKGYIHTPEGKSCQTLTGCFFVMLRLSFLDEMGFNFLQGVSDEESKGSVGFAFLLVIYLIMMAIILFNGLIQIYGVAFVKQQGIKKIGSDKNTNKDEFEVARSFVLSVRKEINHGISVIKKTVGVPEEATDATTAAAESTHNEKIAITRRKKTHIQISDYMRAKIAWSQTTVFQIFMVFTSIFILVEPFIVGFRSDGVTYKLQIYVLIMSSCIYPFGVIMIALYDSSKRSYLEKFGTIIMEPEVYFELLCLAFGWAFIFHFPGIAALRCIRLFRLLWYVMRQHNKQTKDDIVLFSELYRTIALELQVEFDIDSAENVNSNSVFLPPSEAIHICLQYLSNIGNELFTAKSRGGTVVLFLFFYATYLFAVVFWNEKGYLYTSDGLFACSTLKDCFLTMLRLSFYDGNGLNYLTAVAYEQIPIYSNVTTRFSNTTTSVSYVYAYTQLEAMKTSGSFTFLLILYMLLCAIVLLYALIGIFGAVFVIDDVEEEKKAIDVKLNEAKFKDLLELVKSLRDDVITDLVRIQNKVEKL